jgi:hypothetical protein
MDMSHAAPGNMFPYYDRVRKYLETNFPSCVKDIQSYGTNDEYREFEILLDSHHKIVCRALSEIENMKDIHKFLKTIDLANAIRKCPHGHRVVFPTNFCHTEPIGFIEDE